MAENLGGIFWSADIRTEGLNKSAADIGKSTKSAERGFSELDSTVQKTEKSMFSLTKVAGALGTALATMQLKNYVINTAAAIDEQAKFSQALGVSYEQLQKLQFAAGQNGASINALNNGLRKLAKGASEAANGTGEALKAFNQLGIEAKALQGLSPDQIFAKVADAMAGVESSGDQAAIAMRLFGNEGALLLNTLRGGSAGLKQMGDELERIGGVISNDTAKAAADFNDQMDKLQRAASGVGSALVGSVLPHTTSFLNVITEVVSNGPLMSNVLNGIGIAATATAIVIATKLVVAIAASAASMIGAAASAVRYQIALASMAGVSASTAVAVTALGAASRAAAVAMGALGGPAGILLIAGAALLAFSINAKEAKDKTGELVTEADNLFIALAGIEALKDRRAQLSEFANTIDTTKDRIATLTAELERLNSRSRGGGGLRVDVSGEKRRAEISEELIALRAKLAEAEKNLAGATNNAKLELAEYNKTAAETETVTQRQSQTFDQLFQDLINQQMQIKLTSDEYERYIIMQRLGSDASKEQIAAIQGEIDNLQRLRAERQAAADEAQKQRDEEAKRKQLQSDVRFVGVTDKQAELTRLADSYAMQQNMLQQALELELLTREEYALRREELERQTQERINEINNTGMVSFTDRLKEAGFSLEQFQNQAIGSFAAVLTGAMSGKDAIRGLAQSILTTAIGALIKMAITAAIGQKAAVATGVATAGALSTAYATPAALVSLATMGANAVPASAGIASTTALAQGLAMGGGRLNGGPVNPGTMYPVTEDGKPELLIQGGRQYLLPGNRGEVVSNKDMAQVGQGGGQTVNFTLQVSRDMAMDRAALSDALFDLEPQIYEMMENQKYRRGEL